MKRSWDVFKGLSNDDFTKLESLIEEYHLSNQDIEYAPPDHPVFDYQCELQADIASILYREAEVEFYYQDGGLFPYQCRAAITYKGGFVSKQYGESRESLFAALRNCLAKNVHAILRD
jgi:hypothetical protein